MLRVSFKVLIFIFFNLISIVGICQDVTELRTCHGLNTVIILPGNPVPNGTFQWQVYLNGAWQNIAVGANDNDYRSTDNGSAVSELFTRSYRRQVISGGVTSYDSYYNTYFDPGITNNQIGADRNFVCAAGSKIVDLTGNVPSAGSGDIIYQWLVSTDNVNWQPIDGATQKDYQLTFDGTNPMYYSRLARSGICEVHSNNIKIDYVGTFTPAAAGSPQMVCGQTHVTLHANTPTAAEVGTWSVISPTDYNPFNSANMHNPNAEISALPYDVDIKLKWTIEYACGQPTESVVTVYNYSQPGVDAGNTVIINEGGSTVLNGSISPGNYTFEWVPATGLSDPTILNPVASPVETTLYTLTAYNGNDCNKQAMVKVIVDNGLITPNTITPNGDGVNDTWAITNIENHTDAEVQIFDRIGRQVFYSKGYGKKWDATYKGKKLPAAVYYYVITINSINIKKAGWVTVIY